MMNVGARKISRPAREMLLKLIIYASEEVQPGRLLVQTFIYIYIYICMYMYIYIHVSLCVYRYIHLYKLSV